MKTTKLALFLVLAVSAIVALSACAPVQLHPSANRVIASKNPAPKGCKYLGAVVGSQGGMISGAWTSNKNMAEGSMNDIKNKAAALNANYVQLETDRAGVTASGSYNYGVGSSSSGQTDVTLAGNAYYCNPSDIGLE